MSAAQALFVDHGQQGPDKDERFTPAWVFDGLGLAFDTDPASPGHGCGDVVPATTKLTIADDGLTAPWSGRVWLNPPFSNATPWAQRWIAHGNGVFLGPIANAQWAQDLMTAADLLWLCRDFAFTHPTHAGKRSSMPLFMAAMGSDCADGLRRLAMSGRHDGVLVRHELEATSATRPALTAAAPLMAGEHPFLPRNIFEIHQAQDDQLNRAGRVLRAGHPAYARIVVGFHGVLRTADPDRIDGLADELHALADALRTAQQPQEGT